MGGRNSNGFRGNRSQRSRPRGPFPLSFSPVSDRPVSHLWRSTISNYCEKPSKASSGGRFTCFDRDLSVIGSIPVINGNSLTGLFFGSIGTELTHWPTGPALTSPFWLWMITWHLGLFLCLTFGQISFKGRGDDYFKN